MIWLAHPLSNEWIVITLLMALLFTAVMAWLLLRNPFAPITDEPDEPSGQSDQFAVPRKRPSSPPTELPDPPMDG